MFASQTVTEPSKVTKTGARHSFAKWLLLPSCLRVKFENDEFDYDNVKAGFVPYKDCVFILFRIDRKYGGGIIQNQDRPSNDSK